MKLKNKDANRMINGLRLLGGLNICNYEINYTIEKNQVRLNPITEAYSKSAKGLNREFNLIDEKDKDKRNTLLIEGEELDEIENDVKIIKIKRSIIKKLQDDKKPEGITANICVDIREMVIEDIPIPSDMTEE